jgi:hypothetical protein
MRGRAGAVLKEKEAQIQATIDHQQKQMEMKKLRESAHLT